MFVIPVLTFSHFFFFCETAKINWNKVGAYMLWPIGYKSAIRWQSASLEIFVGENNILQKNVLKK